MGKRLYVKNLPFRMTEQELATLFSTKGSVASVRIIVDRLTRRSKGFGFVEMQTDAEAEKVMADLNGFNIGGRPIAIEEAIPTESNGEPRGERNDRGSRGDRNNSRGNDRNRPPYRGNRSDGGYRSNDNHQE